MGYEILQQKDGAASNIYEKVDNGVEGDVPTILSDGSKEWTALPVRYFLPSWTAQTVKQGTLTVDGGWTMVSNKDTSERPSPQPIGEPQYGFDNNETYVENSNTSVVYSGQQYTFSKGGWIERIRVRIPELSATTNYRFIIADVTDPSTPIVTTVEEPVLVAGDWTEIAIGSRVIRSGAVLIAYVDALNTGSSTNISGGWTYEGTNQNSGPTTSEWNRRNQNNIVRISKTDADLVDRSAELGGVLPDSDMSFVQTNNTNKSRTYRVTGAPVDQGTYYEYPVTTVSTGSEGEPDENEVCTVDIDVPVPQSTKYYEVTDHWLTQPDFATITGFLQFDGVSQPGKNNNGFGIDIRFQEAYVSPDWEFIAESAFIGNTTNQALTELSTAAASAGDVGALSIPDADDVVLVFDNVTKGLKISKIEAVNALMETDSTLIGDGSVGDPLRLANEFTDADETKLDSIESGAQVNTVDDVAGKTGSVVLVKSDISNFNDADYATAAQGLLADSATQPGANVSSLTNDAGYLTGVNFSTTNVLVAISASASQAPAGTDNPLKIEFGPAQFTGSDPVMIDASGNITFNEAGLYEVNTIAHMGRSGGAGESEIRFRKVSSVVGQMGPTIGYKLDSDKFIEEVADTSIGYYQVGEVLYYEVYRDSSGNNSGELMSQAVNLGGWNPCPSAAIVITRINLPTT